ncbi:MAG TPA: PAS domain S-box protein, partial [Burkholderiales bacterium]
GGIASALRTAESEAIARAGVEGRNLARSLAEHVASSVRVLDLVLIDLREEWIASALPFPEHVARLQESLTREDVSQVIVVNADGRIAYSKLPGLQGLDVSGRRFFKMHKELGERDLYISAPEFDPELAQWTIKFTRPIYDLRGRFAGVLTLFLPPPALERIYNDIELGEGAVITLARTDGQILARSRGLAGAAGVSLAETPGLAADAAPAGSYRRQARTDGIERLYAYQKVPSYQLTVFVGQTLDTILAPYRVQRTTYVASGALATLLLLIIPLLLVSRQRAKEQAERALQDRIAHLQLVYDTSSVAIFDVNAQGLITHANRRMAEMFGCSRESLVGSGYVSHLHPEEREEGTRAMFALMAGETKELDLERRYCRADQSEFWGHITGRCIIDGNGKIIDWVGVIADVTQTKRAVEALRRNEAHLRELFDAFPIAIAHISRAEYMTFANRIYREIYGDDYQGRSVREFVGDEVYALFEPYVRRALNGEVVQYERAMPGKDGQPTARLLRYIPDRDESGEVTGFFVLREDITERRRAEEEIRRLNEDLERGVLERTAELRNAVAALQAEVTERLAAETAALDLAERLQTMARRLGEAQEVERRRLAAELHDGVCSNLAAIGLNLALFKKQLPQSDSANAQRRLSALIAQVDEAKANAKDISIDLRPLLLEAR